jgi:hypothetical protein
MQYLCIHTYKLKNVWTLFLQIWKKKRCTIDSMIYVWRNFSLNIKINFLIPVEAWAGMPNFIGQLQNVTVSEGRDATFTCSVTNLGGHKVMIPSEYLYYWNIQCFEIQLYSCIRATLMLSFTFIFLFYLDFYFHFLFGLLFSYFIWTLFSFSIWTFPPFLFGLL